MRTVFFSPSTTPTPSHSSSIMDAKVEIAESIITKWTDTTEGSLYDGDRRDAKPFLRSVNDLHAAMHFFASDDPSSENLARAQRLMQAAMKMLQKEFYRILSTNRSYLDPESVSNRSSRTSARSSTSDFEDDTSEDEIQAAGDSVSEVEKESELAMVDLKSIADTMISSGYGKECVQIYKTMRKSIVEESLYTLGVEKLGSSQVQKMDWEVIELKTKSWLRAVKFAVKSLFKGEKILCEHVFSASPIMAESCLAEIVRDNAMTLFGFPELVAKSKKLSPEKMFRILDLYDAISDLWPEIESIFSYESISSVRSQAVNCLIKLGDAARLMLTDFELAIQKDGSKESVPGGGVHPLTRYVMNYLIFLSDYSGPLFDILANSPLSIQSPMPESYFLSPVPDDDPASAVSAKLAWLILVLLCKLDIKARLYKDVSLSYLFLANNLNYIISKVRTSNLKLLLGGDWLVNHEKKVKQFAANYERTGWSKVISALPENNPTANIPYVVVKECFRSFNSAFVEVYRKQTSWVVPDPKLRDEIKVSVAMKLVPLYRDFYDKYRAMFPEEANVESIVRYAPDDLGNYLSDLFFGTGASGSVASASYSSSTIPHSHDGEVN